MCSNWTLEMGSYLWTPSLSVKLHITTSVWLAPKCFQNPNQTVAFTGIAQCRWDFSMIGNGFQKPTRDGVCSLGGGGRESDDSLLAKSHFKIPRCPATSSASGTWLVRMLMCHSVQRRLDSCGCCSPIWTQCRISQGDIYLAMGSRSRSWGPPCSQHCCSNTTKDDSPPSSCQFVGRRRESSKFMDVNIGRATMLVPNDTTKVDTKAAE